MGLLFAQAGVHMLRNGVFMVITKKYTGTLRQMPVAEYGLWLFELQDFMNDDDDELVGLSSDIIDPVALEGINRTSPVIVSVLPGIGCKYQT